MKRNIKLVLMAFTIGIIILLVLAGGHSIYASAKAQKEIVLSKCTLALNEAIIKERNKYTDVKYFHYDAKQSPNPSIPIQEKQEWMDQEILTREDPCRHRLDSLFQAELAEQGIQYWTGIKCNRNGEINASRPEEQFQHATILDEVQFRLEENSIVLQAFIKIPNRMLINWELVCMLIIFTLLGIGILIWIILQKEEKQPVISRKNKPSSKANTVELIVPAENKTIIQWKQLASDVLYEENRHIVKRGTLEVPLQGNKVIYFEALCEAPNHKLTYEELAVIVQERHGEIPKSVEKASRLEKDKFRHIIKELGIKLKPIGIQILNERGKGYQMIFPDEKEE